MRRLKKIRRWNILPILLFILLFSPFLLQNTKVQTAIAKKVANHLSNQLQTKVEVGALDFDFFTHITLNDIYIEDRGGDTLLFVQELQADMVKFAPFKNTFILSNASIEGSTVRLVRHEGDELMNLGELFQKEETEETEETKTEQTKKQKKKSKKKPLQLSFDQLELKAFDFTLRDSLKNKAHDLLFPKLTVDFNTFNLNDKIIDISSIELDNPTIALRNIPSRNQTKREDTLRFSVPQDWKLSAKQFLIQDGSFENMGKARPENKAKQFLFNNFLMNDLNLSLKNLNNKEGNLAFVIEEGNFIDNTGFEINRLEANAALQSDQFAFKQLHIETPQSIIDGDLAFNLFYLKDFADFENRIGLNTDLENVKLNPKDLAYLFGKSPVQENIYITGKLNGKVRSLFTEDFELRFEHGSLLRGDIHARGLPDLQNTFFDAKIDELKTTQFGIAQIAQKEMPEKVTKFGNISYSGDFLGYLNELVAFGTIRTDIGTFDTDLKFSTENKIPDYSGYISSSDFQIGYWLDNQDLDRIDFSASVSGTGLQPDVMNLDLDVTIDSFDFKEATYQNIEIDGGIKDQILRANASLGDEKLKGIVDGSLNFGTARAEIDFSSDIENADLYQLQLMKKPISIAGKFYGQLKGNNIYDLTGDLKALDNHLTTEKKTIEVDSLSVSVQKDQLQETITLDTETISVNLVGKYDYTQLPPTVLTVLTNYYDINATPKQLENAVDLDEDILFEASIDKDDELVELLVEDIDIIESIDVSGKLNSKTKELSIEASTDEIAYKQYKIKDWTLDAFGTGDVLIINSFQKELMNNGKTWLVDSDVNMEFQDNVLLADIRTYNKNFLNAKLTSRLQKQDDGRYRLSILSSDLMVNQNKWSIQKNNSIVFGKGQWEANNFTLQSGEQRISLFNPPGTNNQKLVSHIEKVSLEDINELIGFTKKPFEGKLSGDVILESNAGQDALDVKLRLDSVMYNYDIVKTTTLQGGFDLSTKKGKFTGTVGDPRFQMGLTAYLDLTKEQDILDLDVQVFKGALTPLGNLWSSSIADIEGEVEGYVRVIGGPKKFNLNGDLKLTEDLGFTLRFTQARYSAAKGQNILISRDRFTINSLQLRDENNQRAVLNGVITHEDLTNFALDLVGSYNNFMFLNTTREDNSVFYGSAFADGTIQFSGPVNDALMEVSATSKPGTEIFIESGERGGYSKYDFLTFREPIDTTIAEVIRPDQSKLNMEFDLEITPDAWVSMQFDSDGYNKLRGNGYGLLTVIMDTQGDLQMYGNYDVNQGEYDFNFQNVWQRKFDILPNSAIRWAGNPYDADLAITTKYTVQADTRALVSQSIGEVETDVMIDITGTIKDPKNEFDIEVPNSLPGTELDNLLSQIKSDETLKTEQVGSLLLYGGFSNVNSDPFASNVILNRTVESIISRQINQIINELGGNSTSEWGIDYENYRDLANDPNSPAFGGLDQRLTLQYSRTLLDGKVKIVAGPAFNFGENLDREANSVFDTGDIILEWDVDNDGQFELSIFSIREFNFLNGEIDNRNGIGYIFEKDFNTWKELWEKSDKKDSKTNRSKPEPEEDGFGFSKSPRDQIDEDSIPEEGKKRQKPKKQEPKKEENYDGPPEED